MKKFIVCLDRCPDVGVAAFAADDEREEDRVKDAGVVLKEILNIPDDIPQDLLDKAECVIILPSVKKGAFGIGGSYGRGVMVCRSGEHYKGKWGAPALYALEGVSIGFQFGGQATDFVLLVMNPKGARVAALQQSEAWGGCFGGRRSQGTHGGRRDRHRDECRDSFLFAQQRFVRRSLSGRLDFAFRWQRQRKAVRKKVDRKRNHPRRQSRHSAPARMNWFRCSTPNRRSTSRIRSRWSRASATWSSVKLCDLCGERSLPSQFAARGRATN